MHFTGKIDCMTVGNSIDEMNELIDSLVCWSSALRQLSKCCANLGDVQRAIQLCEELVAIACHCLPSSHPHIAVCESMLNW